MSCPTLKIKRGDTWPIYLECENPDGTPLDLTGIVMGLAITRRNTPESYEAPLLKVDSTARLTITMTSELTKIEGEITDAETRALPLGSAYLWLRDDTNEQSFEPEVINIV